MSIHPLILALPLSTKWKNSGLTCLSYAGIPDSLPHITGGIPHISGGRINLPSGMHPGPMRNLVSDESLWAPAQLCLLLVTPMRIWAIIAKQLHHWWSSEIGVTCTNLAIIWRAQLVQLEKDVRGLNSGLQRLLLKQQSVTLQERWSDHENHDIEASTQILISSERCLLVCIPCRGLTKLVVPCM